MSKTLQKENFPAQYNAIIKRIETHERSDMQDRSLLEFNTAGLTNREIDILVVGGPRGEPSNGIQISDPTNKLILIRQAGIWRKVKVE